MKTIRRRDILRTAAALVAALHKGGRNVPQDRALELVYA